MVEVDAEPVVAGLVDLQRQVDDLLPCLSGLRVTLFEPQRPLAGGFVSARITRDTRALAGVEVFEGGQQCLSVAVRVALVDEPHDGRVTARLERERELRGMVGPDRRPLERDAFGRLHVDDAADVRLGDRVGPEVAPLRQEHAAGHGIELAFAREPGIPAIRCRHRAKHGVARCLDQRAVADVAHRRAEG